MLNKIARGPTIKSNMVGNENGKPWRMSSSLKLKGVHFKNFSPFVAFPDATKLVKKCRPLSVTKQRV